MSEKYGIQLNNDRIELGLKPITDNWALDSIVLQVPARGMNCFPSEIPDTTNYRFLENKWYCQYWTNKEIDKTKPYHKSKKIYFTKSFWIWQNEIDFEYDNFINPNSNPAEYEELEMSTHWQRNGEIYGHLAHMKNGEDLLIDDDVNQSMYGFDKEKVITILEKWGLK
ncbi:hypothetical protein ESY86_20800 [Subsaximicrobium wynnwilliamsii]|uniref:Uncharacterized protein n=1 Tax=Subsaximicrobium wynnwilliamsii TaxID=291179 RepID=A0A5C6ZA59_9FLAO|nr:hypothetical protein [Subsaximicrobium wynnwilliamsii]TXD85775.1 hypothetical protein ESY86_20800 [Subsaximicrobium wynnwilliamsii]TXD99021.1 hypothetical protein ESY88_20755 [Subsaximicrobium wynnwilliamsii]